MLVLRVFVLFGELMVFEVIARKVRSVVFQQLARSLHVCVLVLYSFVDYHLRKLIFRQNFLQIIL